MRILMINPRGMYFDHGVSAYKRISYPMGLMSLSSALKRIVTNDESSWHVLADDRNDRQVALIDSAAEGFGAEDGKEDLLITRNGKKIRLYGLSDEKLTQRAIDFNPDVVFVSALFTKLLDEFYHTTRLIKQCLPDALVVAGGIAVTDLNQLPTLGSNPENIAQRKRAMNEPFDNGVDVIVLGEGELSVVKLIDHLENNPFIDQSLDQIENLRYRVDGAIRETVRKKISSEEFNHLPFPDLSIVKKEYYSKTRAHFGQAKSDHWIELFTSRGCSKSCTFCTVSQYFGSCYRPLRLERVRELLAYYLENGYDEVCIEDDSILDDPRRATKIFNMIKEMGFSQFTAIGGIEFRHLLFDPHGEKYFIDKLQPEYSSEWLLDEKKYHKVSSGMSTEEISHRYAELVDGAEIVRAMSSDIDPKTGKSKQNGCYRIYLAMESANPETLEAIGKGRTFPLGSHGERLQRLEREAISMLRQAGIEAHGGMMMGNPRTEGIPELMNNVRFCREMMGAGLGRIAFFPYIMLPGSHMSTIENADMQYARIRKEHGYLVYGFDMTNADSLAHGWTAEELITLNVWANLIFDSGKGRNWTVGRTIGRRELEKKIEQITKPGAVERLTIKRLQQEDNADALLEYYLSAIKKVRGDDSSG